MTTPDRPRFGPPKPGIANLLLKLIGWRVQGCLPNVPKLVLIVAPHTSNWDFLIGLVCAYALGLLSTWPYGVMAKSSLFKGWFGKLMRWIGGVPIDRSSPQNLVGQMVDIFKQRERLMLVITPEGTRKLTGYWKSGFYHIAVGAGVPIVLAYLDYKSKTGGIGPTLHPSGNLETDAPVIQEFYAHVTAKHPRKTGEIRFKT